MRICLKQNKSNNEEILLWGSTFKLWRESWDPLLNFTGVPGPTFTPYLMRVHSSHFFEIWIRETVSLFKDCFACWRRLWIFWISVSLGRRKLIFQHCWNAFSKHPFTRTCFLSVCLVHINFQSFCSLLSRGLTFTNNFGEILWVTLFTRRQQA